MVLPHNNHSLVIVKRMLMELFWILNCHKQNVPYIIAAQILPCGGPVYFLVASRDQPGEKLIHCGELLQEAEADETKKSDCQQKHHVIKSGEIGGARASTGGRRRKRDGGYITERQTKGGSLQNIPQEVNAEFDHESSFSYCLRGKMLS
ncbi:unnamed protein product [Timema podura]|uniref:Uncharacterized protein n=1 Tax=Timema podura TaxID=61482 RepID=A0ABN7NLK6_TIMPD|nr:unnamed protein product [Timema podura]